MKTKNTIGNYTVNVGDIAQSIDAIDNMVDLNKVISVIKNKQKTLRAELASMKRNELSVGDTVNISTKTGNRVGVITKVNRTRCDVTIKGTSKGGYFEGKRVI
jgi:demethoxyubiquinone hydroxylase (CLK1/Coq7/Cat5 family)